MPSFYKRKRVPDKAIHVKSRISYIQRIARALQHTPQLFPRPDQERLYLKALAHIVDVLSAEKCALSTSGNKNTYLENMKDILHKLQCMERKRLYDPPSDHEIGYHLLIKKCSRPMFHFHKTQMWASNPRAWRPCTIGPSCFSPFSALHFLEELEEINCHIKHISANLSNMAFGKEFSVKQLLGVSTMEKDEVPPMIRGSKEKSNMFYYHKFMLAIYDMRSSHHSLSPPSPEEKECFDQVLFCVEPPPSSLCRDTVDVYLGDLGDLFVERLLGDAVHFKEDCTRIALEILMKLSINFSQDTLLKMVAAYDKNAREQDKNIIRCHHEMVEKCSISCSDLPAYIESVDRAIKVMVYILTINGSLETLSDYVYLLLVGCPHKLYSSEESIDWEGLHALTLFRHGNFFPVRKLGEENMLQKCFKQGKEAEVQNESNGNMKALKGILEELRGIGDWGLKPLPTYEEQQVFHKIWRSVVSSIHFFKCAMAYQQSTDLIAIGQTNTARRSTSKTKRCIQNPSSFFSHLVNVDQRVSILLFILQGFREGLVEKHSKCCHAEQQSEEVGPDIIVLSSC